MEKVILTDTATGEILARMEDQDRVANLANKVQRNYVGTGISEIRAESYRADSDKSEKVTLTTYNFISVDPDTDKERFENPEDPVSIVVSREELGSFLLLDEDANKPF
ncbi:hypothetical protein CMI41_03890 [Candidatus Pacearchaeota archaeon]|nr:hypothetical protein [Candidatus Pacearchaeota archaeon]|tara:strand:- start:4379 stop:4702 length:324 start_codon:yes stop_codon:yes gene_type:complete